MQLANKVGIENTTVFYSPRAIIPMRDDERREILSSLSSADAIILGSVPSLSKDKLPMSAIVLDWVNLLGLIDLSNYDRILLVDSPDENERIESLLALGKEPPMVLYSSSENLDGILPHGFLRWDFQQEAFFPSFELDDDMLSAALGAFLSSRAYRCENIHHALATGTASLARLTRENLRRSVKTMSCDALEVPAHMFSRWIVSLDLPAFEEKVISQARMSDDERVFAQMDALPKLTALQELLDAAYGKGNGLFDGFTVSRSQVFSGFCRTDREVVDRLRANGMESFLDAALSGVSVEDLLA